MQVRKLTLTAALLIAVAPAAFATSGTRWVGGDAGFELHHMPGTKSRAEVKAELAEAQESPEWDRWARFGIPFSQKSVATARSREEVRLEAVEAVRAGQISIGGM